MGVDVFGHTLSFMPDNFLDESLVNFLFGKEKVIVAWCKSKGSLLYSANAVRASLRVG